MAIVKTLNEQEQIQWDEWVKSRPPVIQELATKLPPTKLYKMKSTGSRVLIDSYNEDGTVAVLILGKYNIVMFERWVVGIDPDDLEETDLPPPDEEVGAILTDEEDIETFVSFLRKQKSPNPNSSPEGE